jgi:phosphatidylserine/phosphatidylglycerophosphate/cardiolipin synthase-like enzyme
MNQQAEVEYEWLDTGGEMLNRMLAAIAEARQSIRLEMYIVHTGAMAELFREALIQARRRGVSVQVLVDAMGSMVLPESFWDPLRAAGGEFRWFNPLSLTFFSIRDHRKLLTCDERLAFVGGVNIASEYQGDGVTKGLPTPISGIGPFRACASRRGKKPWPRPPRSCCWAGRAATTRSGWSCATICGRRGRCGS